MSSTPASGGSQPFQSSVTVDAEDAAEYVTPDLWPHRLSVGGADHMEDGKAKEPPPAEEAESLEPPSDLANCDALQPHKQAG